MKSEKLKHRDNIKNIFFIQIKVSERVHNAHQSAYNTSNDIKFKALKSPTCNSQKLNISRIKYVEKTLLVIVFFLIKAMLSAVKLTIA